MIVCIDRVIDAEGLAALRRAMASGTFADGQATAGWSARRVKRNEQLAAGPAASQAQRIVLDALAANPVFAAAAMPRRFAPPLLARYGVGQAFGTHVDNAVMGPEHLRTDVSVTLFLSPPEDYDGGELVIEAPGGEAAYKLAAGAAIAYPATSLHRVEAVTRGTREVAVTWVQSLVRSAEKREMLFDLERARRALFDREGKTAEFDLLHKTAANLRRMWVEP